MSAVRTTIFGAANVITMNPARPRVTHVAVREGRILGAGALEELTGFGEYTLDNRFSDKTLMPGFVEGHCHLMEGVFWRFVYCGFFDRSDPDGKVWHGLKSAEHVIDRLREAEQMLKTSDDPLAGWSLDPLFFEHPSITRHHLDQVSDTRPIGVLHASCHILCVNTRTLELAGLFRSGINHPGIPLGPDGLPTGELRGHDAMAAASAHVKFDRSILASDEIGFRQFARQCVRNGVTTATDLAGLLPDDAVEMMLRVTGEDDYPVRIVAFRKLQNISVPDIIERALELQDLTTDQLRLGAVKVVADGSIQGFTARMRWPGYYNGAPNGLWYIPPEQLQEIYRLALKHGVLVHTHTNGDQATELVLNCVESALRQHPHPDHRFTMQHCQLADAAQFRKIGALGMCANLFSNHLYYWGDQHYAYTVGPERAERMNACATAIANSIRFAIHSDAPITPLSPLFTAWCAVNRKTASGRVLGKEECIKVNEALKAITIGAAYTLKLDGEIGSIECGKKADFAVLEDDPTVVEAQHLKDVQVWGTVQGGRIFSAAEI